MYLEYLDYQTNTGRLEDSSRKSQLSIYNNYIKPYLENYSFITLDRTALTLWITKLYNKGLGGGTISNAFYQVKKVYDFHYETGDLIKHPFAGIKAPKNPPPKITHLTKEQMDDYLSAVYGNYDPEDKFYAAALILFYSGLRRGEVCGLRWRDIDFQNNTLTVETAIGMGSKTYTKPPKTESSKRTFPMVPQLAEALKLRYETINPEPNWFVCGNETNYWNPQSFSNYFRAFVKEHNLIDAYGKLISPHMLRHNLGAVGIRSNMDIASLSNMMGHGSRAITLDTYGDATKDAMIAASKKLANKFDEDSEFFKLEPEVEE